MGTMSNKGPDTNNTPPPSVTHYSAPLNLAAWIQENASFLKPPVNNKQIWQNSDLVCFVVAGPNQRTDFHVDPFEEYFHQFRGDASLLVADRGKIERVVLKEGDIFLLPANVRHSPQRPDANSLCMVIERHRGPEDIDAFEWYCAGCGTQVARRELSLKKIDEDLPKAFATFYETPDEDRTCPNCGSVHPGRNWQAWHQQLAENFPATQR
jgi:3-hydroxyanthranilate 3,4-dioxygenase